MERLDKILANSGYGTRREVKQLIKSGAVLINGAAAVSPAAKLDPETSVITVGGVPVAYKKFVYLMLNKPAGYVSATEDCRYPPVTDLVPPEYAHFHVFPAGRLDADTEGLLLLTNDGGFAHHITAPKKHVPKLYCARTARPVTAQDAARMEAGMDLGDFTTLPAQVQLLPDGCLLTIYEGKFHQVKRMLEKTGNRVTYLKRLQIGGLRLDPQLPPGGMRELTEEELDSLWT